MYCLGFRRSFLSSLKLLTKTDSFSVPSYTRSPVSGLDGGQRGVPASCACGMSTVSDSGNQEVVIRIPRQMQERMDNLKQVKRKKFQRVITSRPGKMLITSKRPQLNQPASFILGKFDPLVLASKGWKHNKSFGDYFTIHNTQDTPPFVTDGQRDEKEKGGSKTVTFKSLHLSPEIVEALQACGIEHPTTVQLQTIPRLLRGHNLLCAAETGCGKTLSYLLPVVQLLRGETEGVLGGQTRCLVLVPSRELAEQVSGVARSLCSRLGLSVRVVGGGRGVGRIKQAFSHGPPNVLVATPGALYKALRRRCVDLGDLSFLVLDEADTLLDQSFAGLVESILQRVQVASSPAQTRGPIRRAQLVLIGATFPSGVGELLSQVTDLGSIVTVTSRGLHCLMPHVRQTFVKVRGADKLAELLQALQGEAAAQPGGGVLVFCNSAATVNWLGFALEEQGVRHVRLQGQMPAAMRAGIFSSFQSGRVDVLLCTDIASRGLDTQRVRLVVNYDFPHSHTDYLHRAGRVGRAGARGATAGGGTVLNFVTHPWDVELVQKIEMAARRRTALPGMESAIHTPPLKTDPKSNQE